MGKTYRNAPEWYGDNETKAHKIKSVDRKHRKVFVRDGAYGSDTSDVFVSNGKKTVRREYEGEGDFKPREKKIDKRLKSKFERRNSEIPEED